MDLLRDENPDRYEDLKLKVYQWSINAVRGRIDRVLQEIREYTPVFLSYFGIDCNNSRSFVDNASEGLVFSTQGNCPSTSNIFTKDGINIEVTTVHSAKGQTHTATLYLETFYHSRYESERLYNCFLGNDHGCSSGRDIQSIKMAYVGLSRPTHLLCFAVHKDRYNSHLGGLDANIWEIMELC